LYGRLGHRYLIPVYVEHLAHIIEDEVFIQDPNLGGRILRRLREGGIVDIHIDAPFTDARTRLDFLGARRQFPMGFLKIAALCGAPLVPMQCLGDAGAFAIEFGEPLLCPVDGPGEDGLHRVLEALVRQLEARIYQHPEQWELWKTHSRRNRRRQRESRPTR
jgi:lauroyl/myristoyl acyltransferase